MKHTWALLLISLFLTTAFLTACTNNPTTKGATTNQGITKASKNKEIARMSDLSRKIAVLFEYPKSPDFTYAAEHNNFKLTKTSETEKYELIGFFPDNSRDTYEVNMNIDKNKGKGFIDIDINGEKGYSVLGTLKKEREIFLPLQNPKKFVYLRLKLEKKDADRNDDVTPIFESKEFQAILKSIKFDENSPELAEIKDRVYNNRLEFYIKQFAAPGGSGYTVEMRPYNAGIRVEYKSEGKYVTSIEVDINRKKQTMAELMEEFKTTYEKPDRPIKYQDKVYGGITFKDTSLFKNLQLRCGFFEKDGKVYRYDFNINNNESATTHLVESVLKNLTLNEEK